MTSAADEASLQRLSTDQSVSLSYIDWDERQPRSSAPFQVYSTPADASMPCGKSNATFSAREPHVITNVRGREQGFHTDTNGFSFVKRKPCKVLDWSDEEAVTQTYYPWVIDLIRNEISGADSIHVFQHRLRRKLPHNATEAEARLEDPRTGAIEFLEPAASVHVDLGPREVEQILARLTTDSTACSLQGSGSIAPYDRIRVINVWTPLLHPAEDWPLALCDGSTVTSEDFITIRKIRHDSEGDGLCPLYRRHYKWYYLEAQAPDEALLLKNYDSSNSVKAKFAPHAAFRPNNLRPEAPPRISVEARALVLTKADMGLYSGPSPEE